MGAAARSRASANRVCKRGIVAHLYDCFIPVILGYTLVQKFRTLSGIYSVHSTCWLQIHPTRHVHGDSQIHKNLSISTRANSFNPIDFFPDSRQNVIPIFSNCHAIFDANTANRFISGQDFMINERRVPNGCQKMR